MTANISIIVTSCVYFCAPNTVVSA